MQTPIAYVVSIYVDKARGAWVVRDPEGALWSLPAERDAWRRRTPYELSDHSALESVPGHYKCLFDLPF